MEDRRLSIAILPAWYPTRAIPLNGIFVRDHARAVALRNDAAVIVDDGPDPSLRRLFAIDDALEEGIRTFRVRYPQPRLGPLTAVGYLLGIATALLRLRREGRRVDVLHAHVHRAAWAAVLIGTVARLPVVVTEHSSDFGYSGISDRALRRARIAFGRADLVAPVSEYLRGQIEACGIYVPFTVVPNAVDTDQFAPAVERTTPARIVVVAAQIPLKGIDHLLRAVGTVAERRRDFAVDIVGDGPSRAEYEALAGELGIADLVVFHGRREKDDVAATLRRGRFLVLPSLTENLPVSIIEAMACGLPVVASDVGGIRELVDEGTGVLVPPADPHALGTALDSMLDHHGDYDADAIARRARDRFSLPVIGDTWDRLYREVLAQRRAPRDARHPRRGT